MMAALRAGRPLSPAEKRERSSKLKLIGGISMAALLIIAASGSYWLARKWNPTLSETDLCRINIAPTQETVILLDATDPWSPIQKAVIAQEFRNLQARIPRHARVTLYTLDTVFAGLPTPALRLCNPGRAEDFEDFPILGPGGVRVVANPEQVERRWAEGFVAKLDSILARQAVSTGSERSPLLETIRGAAIDVFGSGDVERVPKRTIYIVSDMLQNSPLYSHYTDANWDATPGRALADLSVAGTAALRGVEVHVFLLDRHLSTAARSQTRAGLIEFWDAYLAEQGATLMRVRRIEG